MLAEPDDFPERNAVFVKTSAVRKLFREILLEHIFRRLKDFRLQKSNLLSNPDLRALSSLHERLIRRIGGVLIVSHTCVGREPVELHEAGFIQVHNIYKCGRVRCDAPFISGYVISELYTVGDVRFPGIKRGIYIFKIPGHFDRNFISFR